MIEKKLLIARGDSLPAIVEKVLAERSARISLTIPSGADVGVSVQNFHLLRREAEQAGKQLSVESVDDHILELAALAGIPARNAFFRSKERAVTDIIARPTSNRSPARSVELQAESPKGSSAPAAAPGKPGFWETSRAPKQEQPAYLRPADPTPETVAREDVPEIKASKKVQPSHLRLMRPGRAAVMLGAIIILLGLGWWVGAAVLPQATVTVVATRVPVPFSELVMASVRVTTPDDTAEDRILLPAQSFYARRNLELTFPAAGRERVTARASGTLVVANAFSSEVQILVATTRFLSPEGKIFRLNQRSVILGARVLDGSILPATTTVAVTADEPGETWNVPASSGWRIPGFEGTPKFEKFTAAAPDAMRGGFVGERAAPTPDEIAAAEKSLGASLRDALESELALVASDSRFVALPKATKFTVDRYLRSAGDDAGAFRLFSEASMNQIVFDDAMLRAAVGARAVRLQAELAERAARGAGPGEADAGAALDEDGKPLAVDSVDVTFGEPTVDFLQGTITVMATGTVALRHELDSRGLASLMLGKDEAGLRVALTDTAAVSKVTVRMWPFWVHRTPSDPSRITVVVE